MNECVNKVLQDSLMQVFCAALSFPAQIAFIQDVGQMSLRRFPCRYRFYRPIMQLDWSACMSHNDPRVYNQKCSCLVDRRAWWKIRRERNEMRTTAGIKPGMSPLNIVCLNRHHLLPNSKVVLNVSWQNNVGLLTSFLF